MKIPGRPDESSPVSLLRCCLHPPSMVDSQRRQVLLQVVRPPLLRPAHGAPPLWHIKHDVPGCPGCGHAGDVAGPAEPEGCCRWQEFLPVPSGPRCVASATRPSPRPERDRRFGAGWTARTLRSDVSSPSSSSRSHSHRAELV